MLLNFLWLKKSSPPIPVVCVHSIQEVHAAH